MAERRDAAAWFERDLGLATLRLEAAWSFARLTARRNGGPVDPELELLGGFVAEDDGAAAADELLRRVTRGLRSGVHAGLFATFTGAAAVGLASSDRRGPALLAALLSLAVVLVVAGPEFACKKLLAAGERRIFDLRPRLPQPRARARCTIPNSRCWNGTGRTSPTRR